MKNLSLKTCMNILKNFDVSMFNYLDGRNEKSLNMYEISDYARSLKA